MLNIKPISEDQAENNVKKIFEEIKKTLGIEIVPALFKYIANYPDFLKYSWDRIKPVVISGFFDNAKKEIENLSSGIVEIIYFPSQNTSELVNSLSRVEKQELENTVKAISRANAALVLISMAIRESLKGIIVKDSKLIEGGVVQGKFGLENNLMTTDKITSEFPKDLIPESDSLLATNYPQFYELIRRDMLDLAKTEKYLRSRVEIEKMGQLLIERFPISIDFPYKETVQLLQKNENSGEILYLLNSTFPSSYPHHLLTGSVMKQSLSPSKNIQTV